MPPEQAKNIPKLRVESIEQKDNPRRTLERNRVMAEGEYNKHPDINTARKVVNAIDEEIKLLTTLSSIKRKTNDGTSFNLLNRIYAKRELYLKKYPILRTELNEVSVDSPNLPVWNKLALEAYIADDQQRGGFPDISWEQACAACERAARAAEAQEYGSDTFDRRLKSIRNDMNAMQNGLRNDISSKQETTFLLNAINIVDREEDAGLADILDWNAVDFKTEDWRTYKNEGLRDIRSENQKIRLLAYVKLVRALNIVIKREGRSKDMFAKEEYKNERYDLLDILGLVRNGGLKKEDMHLCPAIHSKIMREEIKKS